MPRSNRRRPGVRQIATGDFCKWPCCDLRTSPGRLMCPGCWHRVPPRLRDAYGDAKTVHGPDSRECADAIAAITEWARRHELAEQEARTG